jgi:hypothetical protein
VSAIFRRGDDRLRLGAPICPFSKPLLSVIWTSKPEGSGSASTLAVMRVVNPILASFAALQSNFAKFIIL